MKLTRTQLTQLIKEEIVQAIKEGDVVQGPWGKTEEDPGIVGGEELPEEYQYEYVLDELVNAARDGIMPIAIDKLKAANAYREGSRSNTPGDIRIDAPGFTYNDIELEIEEPLLDALKPLAKLIQAKTDRASEDNDDDW